MVKNVPFKPLTKKAQVYYSLLQNQPTTALELAGWLKISIHTVMPRLTELRKEGLIEAVGRQLMNGKSYTVYQTCGNIVVMT